jgi:hypothetical protein
MFGLTLWNQRDSTHQKVRRLWTGTGTFSCEGRRAGKYPARRWPKNNTATEGLRCPVQRPQDAESLVQHALHPALTALGSP